MENNKNRFEAFVLYFYTVESKDYMKKNIYINQDPNEIILERNQRAEHRKLQAKCQMATMQNDKELL